MREFHKSATTLTSHGFSQPPRASSRSTSAAVKPQMSIPRTRNAGLLRPLGIRSIGALAEMPANLAGPRAYHQHRLALGVPEANDFGYEKIFALDAGLEELNGVSFNKGCYIGQELTSRMKHRATSRKRILTVTAETPLPATGPVTRDGMEIGELISSHGNIGFALVRLDRLEQGGAITAAQIPIVLHSPAWLSASGWIVFVPISIRLSPPLLFVTVEILDPGTGVENNDALVGRDLSR